MAAHTLGMVHLVLTMEKRVCIVRGGVHLSATVYEGGSSVPIHDGDHSDDDVVRAAPLRW